MITSEAVCRAKPDAIRRALQDRCVSVIVISGATAGGEVTLSYGSVYEWRTLGRSMTYLILEAALFFVITLCIDAHTRKGRANLLPASLHGLYARCVPDG